LSADNLGILAGLRNAVGDPPDGAPQSTAVTLRPYQAEAIESTREAYRNGALAPLLVLPTGGGKTVVFSAIAASAVVRGRRVLVLAHRRELIRQASQKLAAAGVPHGVIAPGHEATDDLVQVASVQTLARRLGDPRYAAFEQDAEEIRTVEGDLQEVTAEQKAQIQAERFRLLPLRRLLEEAQSESDLRAIAAARGYKRGWVQHVLRERASA
jgi:superfamily II DNA or RNA helicase